MTKRTHRMTDQKLYRVTELVPMWVEHVALVRANSKEEALERYYNGLLESEVTEIVEALDGIEPQIANVEEVEP